MAGPLAARTTKQLLRQLQVPVSEELAAQTASLIAQLRVSAEGQEGMAAFFEKREPGWQADTG